MTRCAPVEGKPDVVRRSISAREAEAQPHNAPAFRAESSLAVACGALGLRIGRADVAIQCAHPTTKVARELGIAARGHVLLMQRTSYTVVGKPCEHMRISIVPERYTIRMSVPGPMELARAIQPDRAAASSKPQERTKGR